MRLRMLMLLTVLISLNCFGQDTVYSNIQFGVYGTVEVLDTSVYISTLSNTESDTLYYTDIDILNSALYLLLIRYEKYSEECYNDSSILEYKIQQDGSIMYFGATVYEVDTISNLWIDITKPTYEHKQPTFHDFMEWLKLKYNKERL